MRQHFQYTGFACIPILDTPYRDVWLSTAEIGTQAFGDVLREHGVVLTRGGWKCKQSEIARASNLTPNLGPSLGKLRLKRFKLARAEFFQLPSFPLVHVVGACS